MTEHDTKSIGVDDDGNDFSEAKSPNYLESRSSASGALRSGPVPVYTSPEVVGLLAQYVAIGLCYGALPNLMYPLFAAYFHMTGSQFNSVKTLMGIGWSVKVFIGLLSDCVPLFGYRRKSWMLFGWSFCFLFMVVLATRDFGRPYYTDRSIVGIAAAKLTAAQNATLNADAPATGATVSILCGLATLSYIFAAVPSDALVVAVAQREPMAVRGRLQSMVYMTRTLATMLSSAMIGFGLNSPDFSGSFGWDMGQHTIFVLLAVVTGAMVPITWWCVLDERHPIMESFRAYAHQFWNLVQKRATWQIMLFSLLFNLLNSGVTSTAAPYVMLRWAKVENLNYQLMNVAGNLVFAVTLGAMGGWGTMWNWPLVVVVTTVAANAIDAFVQFLTIYDVLRNQWFYIGVPLAENLPYAMQFIVTTFVIVELAEEGNEGITYGLFTTVTNLPIAVGPVISNAIFSSFDVSENAIAADSVDTRHQVAWTYIIYYFTTIAACLTVVLLPSQKPALHALQATGGKHPFIGGAVLVVCLVMLVYSVVASLLPMYETTSCLVVAGGKGCNQPSV
ncbi:hypothetical protein DYB28_003391 [Aphanomyces astaci]|uniref:Uncharacterized protein n=1 Tax=Aphanomyces astaci TaxID=112090 RepID=A0A397F713_APHAT|nr:hypothetical protein DYB25_002326 [Aphanomyces astaci]RHY10269.1 hypothetical protein DYB36_007598 [Aphanomyces astaci]RHY37501.1 hypothetical protein DYB38_004273 [Aphanomyces astaci]RHY43801.1 hypothetical protein DYB34_002519 [Aphanomyces astaci]RHY66076.1 hypothetical protein DYB30_002425 [Aphanomyces astaci]